MNKNSRHISEHIKEFARKKHEYHSDLKNRAEHLRKLKAHHDKKKNEEEIRKKQLAREQRRLDKMRAGKDHLTVAFIVLLVVFGAAIVMFDFSKEDIAGKAYFVLSDGIVQEKESEEIILDSNTEKSITLRIQEPIISASIDLTQENGVVVAAIEKESIYAGNNAGTHSIDISRALSNSCMDFPCDIQIGFKAEEDTIISISNFKAENVASVEEIMPRAEEAKALDEQYYPENCKDAAKQSSGTLGKEAAMAESYSGILAGYKIVGNLGKGFDIKTEGKNLLVEKDTARIRFEKIFERIKGNNEFVLATDEGKALLYKSRGKQADFIVELEGKSLLEERAEYIAEIRQKENEIKELRKNLREPSYKAVAGSLFGNEELNNAVAEKEEIEVNAGFELAGRKIQIDNIQNDIVTQIEELVGESLAEEIDTGAGRFTISANNNNNNNNNNGDGIVIERYSKAINAIAIAIDSNLTEKISKLPGVKAVYPNNPVKAVMYDSVKIIGADKIWQMDIDGNDCTASGKDCLTGKGVVVAIVDTGVDYTHPDLGGCLGSGCKVIGGYDFINNDDNPIDDQGHGTHVAGTVAANGIIKGVAPDAKLLAYKVLGADGSGSWQQVISGIERSVDPNNDGDFSDHADIMSLSLGGGGNPDDPVSKAVDNAVNNGVIAIIAAGNSGPSQQTIGSPGTARKAITVGAVDKCDKIADFSSRGPVKWAGNTLIKPDIAAPGVSICSSQWKDAFIPRAPQCIDDNHVAISGTSMATPHVSGLAALMLQANPDMSADEIKSALMTTAKNLGYDVNTQGAGRIDSLKAVNAKVFVYPQSIVFTLDNDFKAEQEIIIVNKNNNDVTFNLDAGAVTDDMGDSYDYASFSEDTVTVKANEKATVILRINSALDIDGVFNGRALIKTASTELAVPFMYSKLSKLRVKVIDLNGKELRDPFLSVFSQKESKIMNGQASEQNDAGISEILYEIKGNSNYIIASIGSYFDKVVEKDIEFILAKDVFVPINSETIAELKVADGKQITVKAKSMQDVPLDMTEWMKALKILKGEERIMSITDFSNGYDDRVVYVSKRPTDKYDFDVMFKYIGVPKENS